MANRGQKRHTDQEYEAELKHVRENLLRMAGCVEQMITDSRTALISGNKELAQRTIAFDHKVNRLEVDTDELCLLILAKRQPLASDLRFITLAMKMVTDLERIGDLGVNISERVFVLDEPPRPHVSEKIGRMTDIVQEMVIQSIDAFVHGDAARAEEIFKRDQEVDDLYRYLSDDLQAAMYDPSFVERGIHLKAVVKFLERIGDHATNLAELVVFFVKGKDIRHLGKLEPSN